MLHRSIVRAVPHIRHTLACCESRILLVIGRPGSAPDVSAETLNLDLTMDAAAAAAELLAVTEWLFLVERARKSRRM
jgi:hypothetical protein